MPIVGKIDQGYIFCGGKSDLYEGRNILGIIITPRCDISHNKVDEIHYLPVIQFDDWKIVEFPKIFCLRLHGDILACLEDKFTKLTISPTIINKFGIDDIMDILAEKKIPNKDSEYILKRLNTLSMISQYQQTNNLSIINTLLIENPGIRKTIIKELLSNKLTNYYVLDSKNGYYIIRLRELKKLQASMFFKIGNGIVSSDLQVDDFKNNDIRINDPDEDMIYPVFVLKSPYIEHLMQCFTLCFSRIGVEDIDYKTCEYMINNW